MNRPPPLQLTNPPPQRNFSADNVVFDERVNHFLQLESIKVELTRNSYKTKFHNLICWEEKTHIEILGDK